MSVGTPQRGVAPPALVGKLRRMARAEARLEALRSELERELDAVRRRYDTRIALLQSRSCRLRADLEAYCSAQREAILPSGRKSLLTPFGEVGFRKAEVAVRLREGLSESKVCWLLRREHLADLVRIKETPDRPAVRKALAEERVGVEQLRRCGLELVRGPDRFHCKVRQDALVEVGRGRR